MHSRISFLFVEFILITIICYTASSKRSIKIDNDIEYPTMSIPQWPDLQVSFAYVDANIADQGNYTFFFWRDLNREVLYGFNGGEESQKFAHWTNFETTQRLNYEPYNYGLTFPQPAPCTCTTWDRNITFDQEFNACQLPLTAVYNGTRIVQGITQYGWSFNWSAQGPNRPCIFWVVKDENNQFIPKEMDALYEDGIFSYFNVTLNPDYDTNFFVYQNFCSNGTWKNCL